MFYFVKMMAVKEEIKRGRSLEIALCEGDGMRLADAQLWRT